MRRRVYPSCCTSAFCGRIDCTGCRNLPKLREFYAWVARTGARCTDPVWCPTVYEAPPTTPDNATQPQKDTP